MPLDLRMGVVRGRIEKRRGVADRNERNISVEHRRKTVHQFHLGSTSAEILRHPLHPAEDAPVTRILTRDFALYGRKAFARAGRRKAPEGTESAIFAALRDSVVGPNSARSFCEPEADGEFGSPGKARFVHWDQLRPCGKALPPAIRPAHQR